MVSGPRSSVRTAVSSDNTVPATLESILSQRWRDHGTFPDKCRPYVSMTQSEGYGKSWLLRELAFRTANDSDNGLRVLYVSAHKTTKELKFPRRTPCLLNYFFPGGADDRLVLLTERLWILVDYAVKHWDAVGRDWLGLFKAVGDADNQIQEALVGHAKHVHPSTAEKLSKARYSDKDPPQRVVVFAVDNARGLVSYADRDDVGRLEHLRCALYAVRTLLHSTHGLNVGIMGLFVDSPSQIIEPPRLPPPSMVRHLQPTIHEQKMYTRYLRIASPETFVASHTVDVWFDSLLARAKTEGRTCSQTYQAMVLNQEPDQQWMTLVRMGRPLWFARHLHSPQTDLVQLAASKLDSVAAVLCRTGLRANSWSPLAKRLVSDNMATLASVGGSQRQFLSAYASEPMLAFGAKHVWYNLYGDSGKKVLAEFRSLLEENPDAVVMTDGTRETLVARLVVVLAMDTTIYASEGSSDIGHGDSITDFQSVDDFLRVLHGSGDGVIESPVPAAKAVLEKSPPTEIVKHLQAEWSQWRMGFNHFVEMYEEPSEDVLWALLAHRAACAFPRRLHDCGVDLMLPIFRHSSTGPPRVSAIHVFVARHVDDHPANRGTRPADGVTRDALRIQACMRLPVQYKPERFYVFDPSLSGVRGRPRTMGIRAARPRAGHVFDAQCSSRVDRTNRLWSQGSHGGNGGLPS